MKDKKPRRAWRRLCRALSLSLFLGLLGLAVSPEPAPGADFFLRLDPLAALALPLAGRALDAAFYLWPGFAVSLSALFFGRFFCGWLCPLGATLDLGRLLSGKISPPPSPPPEDPLRKTKYLILAVVLGAALGGVNLFFWVAPLPLVARFYALLIHPLALWAGAGALDLSREIFAGLDWLNRLAPDLRRYSTIGFVLTFFFALFSLERLRPRFWCRYLCPAGALLGLCSLVGRRRRTEGCRQCGRCLPACPAGALRPPAYQAPASECLACRACAALCPANAVRFSPAPRPPAKEPAAPPASRPISRRLFLGAGAGGLALAATELSGLSRLVQPALRPPGARPEPEFLARCLRCGQCLKACPTNGLQAAWLGAAGLFSPIFIPRLGPCEPDCRACGLVCPTGAVLKLSAEEKKWAKIGGALILRESCLAWAEGRACVVCQEVCPFGAIRPVPVPGTAVYGPQVKADQCLGCGYCERFCPVSLPAVVVRPDGALRLNRADFKTAGAAAGLKLAAPDGAGAEEGDYPEDRLPPGFTE